MIKIRIDNIIQEYNKNISGTDLLQKNHIDKNNDYIAVKINEKIADLSTIIKQDSEVKFVSFMSSEGAAIIKNDAVHILAQAVKSLYPQAILGIGSIIENGFYYDFGNIPSLTNLDLKKIESQMQLIINKKLAITKKIVTKQAGIKIFEEKGEEYKVKIIHPYDARHTFHIYTQGNFSDLSQKIHSPDTSFVKAFKLTKISGVYWKGSNSNETLQRVYGNAWNSKQKMKIYLQTLEKAKTRDHRKIGKQSDLFHLQEDAQGLIFWHPKGWNLFQRLINYIREKQTHDGYFEINTPEIMEKKIWELSGHWAKFRDNMFTATTIKKNTIYAVRPMNCPGGVQVYNYGIRSYKDLPLRLAEFGKVYRFEPSGALHGLMRTRAFTQDDAHIFCTSDQITEECINACKLIKNIYVDFGFDNIKVKFSDRPKERIGSDHVWSKSESALLTALKKQNLSYSINKGEGAFYGPKIEFVLTDAIGRDWQLGTIQIDFNLPERLQSHYIDKDGKKCRPVILHRAVFGSIERFLGILIEHYAGNLPLWLAPIQVAVVTITNKAEQYANTVLKKLKKNKIRCISNFKSENITAKIKKYSIAKIPIIAIIGQKEKNSLVSVRKLGDKNQQTIELNVFISQMINNIK